MKIVGSFVQFVLPTEPCHHAFDVPTTSDCRLCHAGLSAFMMESRRHSSAEEYRRRKFLLKKARGYAMIGVGAEPGLTKGLYIERTNGKSGHVREVLLNDGIRKAC